jgi:hypothetical protein
LETGEEDVGNSNTGSGGSRVREVERNSDGGECTAEALATLEFDGSENEVSLTCPVRE